ncbi:MAG: bi-domain-containing oxidoreductase [Planctomycetaceae bacterium]|nr:bi-domain-containing oxidoreductase [Planctomycetaceae bacterium]
MKQVLQNFKTGQLDVADVPAPKVLQGQVLIKTTASLISTGTERMLVNFAKSSLLGKAQQQPDKVKQVLDKIKTDGLFPTLHSVFSRLDEPLPLGYCNCGKVIEIGQGVEGFEIGDRVASNGSHAEIVGVPKNLCAKVPNNVTDEQAAFTVLASIGLQGIRLINPTLGETIVVYGLGLIGLISAQLLKSAGCKVIGIDIDKNKLDLAKSFGVEVISASGGEDVVGNAIALSGGVGVDGVLITASAKEDSIVHASAQMCRKRGRIVLVGVVNLNLTRSDFYEKELSFQVSCSYGPGRYDKTYEDKGQDYPLPFVRWTENRNFEAVLKSLSDRSLQVDSLISDRIQINDAAKAYQMLTDSPEKMALILTYGQEETEISSEVSIPQKYHQKVKNDKIICGLIGAGNFAKMTLLPAIKSLGLRLKTVADINGVAGLYTAKKFGFEKATNDYKDIINDPEINTVFITTRHDLHAKMVIEALKAGKNVHVEKPLCLNKEELEQIKAVYQEHSSQHLLVGLNRRFSPHVEKIKELLSTRNSPTCMSWVINAGYTSATVWTQDRNIGGGRIIGEGCHWLDVMAAIVGKPITHISSSMIGQSAGVEVRTDKMSITAEFADGSIGTLHYFANGHKSYPKETFTVFCDGKVLALDNFRKMTGYGLKNFKKMNLMNQDKGHKNQFKYFIDSIMQGKVLIPFEQIENVTLASFAAMDSAQNGQGIAIK